MILSPSWTRAEDKVLRERYLTHGAAWVAVAIGRTLSSVHHRARRLRVHRNRRWLPEEDKRLRESWGHATLEQLGRKLDRRPSAVYWRARQIGLDRGCPNGGEYLTAAAERSGYSTEQLRRILRWAGVRISETLSRHNGGARHYHFVDAVDVDDAIARWHKTETVAAAARARGVHWDNLRRWLVDARAAGEDVPPPPRSGLHWRIPSVVIDRVLAARAETESVMAGAMRLGVTRQSLTKWLHAVGVPRGTSKVWRVPRTTIDAAARHAVARPTARAKHAQIARVA